MKEGMLETRGKTLASSLLESHQEQLWWSPTSDISTALLVFQLDRSELKVSSKPSVEKLVTAETSHASIPPNCAVAAPGSVFHNSTAVRKRVSLRGVGV